jgi:hypothetical protein
MVVLFSLIQTKCTGSGGFRRWGAFPETLLPKPPMN